MIKGQDLDTHQRCKISTWNSIISIFQDYFTTSKQIRKEIIDYYDPEQSIIKFVDNQNFIEFISKLKPRTVIKSYKNLLNSQSRILRIKEVDSEYLRSKLELDDLVKDIKGSNNKIEEVVCVLMPDKYDPEFLNLFESFFVFCGDRWLLKGILFCRNSNSVCIVLDFDKKEWVFVNYDGNDKRFKSYKAAFGYANSLGFTALAFFYFNSLQTVEKFGILRGMIEDVKKVVDCGNDKPVDRNRFKRILLKHAERVNEESKKSVLKSVVIQKQSTFQSSFLNKSSNNKRPQQGPISKSGSSGPNILPVYPLTTNKEEFKINQDDIHQNLKPMQYNIDPPKFIFNPGNQNLKNDPAKINLKNQSNSTNTNIDELSNPIDKGDDNYHPHINPENPYPEKPLLIKGTEGKNLDPNQPHPPNPALPQLHSFHQPDPSAVPQHPPPSSIQIQNLVPSPEPIRSAVIQVSSNPMNPSFSPENSSNRDPQNIHQIENPSSPPKKLESPNQPPPLSFSLPGPPPQINSLQSNPTALIQETKELGNQTISNDEINTNRMQPPLLTHGLAPPLLKSGLQANPLINGNLAAPPLLNGGLAPPLLANSALPPPIFHSNNTQEKIQDYSDTNNIEDKNIYLSQPGPAYSTGQAPHLLLSTYQSEHPGFNAEWNGYQGQDYSNRTPNLNSSQPPPLSWGLNPAQGSHMGYSDKIEQAGVCKAEGDAQNLGYLQNYSGTGDINNPPSYFRDYSNEWNNKNPIMNSLNLDSAGIPDLTSIVPCSKCRCPINPEDKFCSNCT